MLIYLNHFLAQQLVLKWFSQYSYRISSLIMFGFTLAIIGIAWGLELAVKRGIKVIKNNEKGKKLDT